MFYHFICIHGALFLWVPFKSVRLEHVQERTRNYFLTDIHEIRSMQHNFKTIGSISTTFVVHILDCINNCILTSNTSSNLS